MYLKFLSVVINIPDEKSKSIFKVLWSNKFHVQVNRFRCYRVSSEQKRGVLRLLHVWIIMKVVQCIELYNV